jgi:16S rRNA G1207 methylase RsmC
LPRYIYDRVVMNPPFDLERDVDHVTHALKFLEPEGQLVARSCCSCGTMAATRIDKRRTCEHLKQRRAAYASLHAKIGCHTFRATGITT